MLLQAFLILSTNINLYPEFFFCSWLISKGLLIYRDFGAQHGPFLYTLLALFTWDRSLTTMKVFYYALETFNLLMVLVILKKTTGKLGFIIAGGLFVILNFYISDNNLWDESILTSFYLVIYYLLIRKGELSNRVFLFIGILISSVSFIKPSFGILLIPLLLYYRKLSPLIPVTIMWLAVLIFYAINHGLNQFWNQYIIYNIHYGFGIHQYFVDRIFSQNVLFFLTLSSILYFIIRKKFTRNPIIIFLAVSAILFLPGLRKWDLPPFVAFLTILSGQLAGRLKRNHLFLYLLIFALFVYDTARQTKHQYVYLHTAQPPYMENRKINIVVDKLKILGIRNNNLYVWGGQIEIYYFLDKLPPVWFYLVQTKSPAERSRIQAQIIGEIRENKIDTIVMPKPLDENYAPLTGLQKYITDSYRLTYEDSDFKLYEN